MTPEMSNSTLAAAFGERSEQIIELATALATAQGDIDNAKKDRDNPTFHYRYATLAGVWDACREPLTKNALSVVQLPLDAGAGKISVKTILMHKSGQYIANTLTLPVTKQDAQGYGSAMTYARRYALMATVGVCPDDDDDAQSAVGEPKSSRSAGNPPAQSGAASNEPAEFNAQSEDFAVRAAESAGRELTGSEIKRVAIFMLGYTPEKWEKGLWRKVFSAPKNRLDPAIQKLLINIAELTPPTSPEPAASPPVATPAPVPPANPETERVRNQVQALADRLGGKFSPDRVQKILLCEMDYLLTMWVDGKFYAGTLHSSECELILEAFKEIG